MPTKYKKRTVSKGGTVSKDVCMEEMSIYWQSGRFSKRLSDDRFQKHDDVAVNEVMTNIGSLRVPKSQKRTDVICNPDSRVQPLKLAMKDDHFGLRPVLTAPNSDFDTVCYHQKACIPASKQVMTNKNKCYHADVFKILEEPNQEFTITLAGTFPKCSESFAKVSSFKDHLKAWFVERLAIKEEAVRVDFQLKNGHIGMSVNVTYPTESEAIYGKWKLADKQMEVNIRNFIRSTIRDSIYFKVNIVEGGPTKGEFEHTRCGKANKFSRTNTFVPVDENNTDDTQYERALKLRPVQKVTSLYGQQKTSKPLRKKKKQTEVTKSKKYYRRMYEGKSYLPTTLIREPDDERVYADAPNAFVGITVSKNEFVTGNVCPRKGQTIDESRIQIAEALAPVMMQAIDKSRWQVTQPKSNIKEIDVIDPRLRDGKGITNSYPKRMSAQSNRKFSSIPPFAIYTQRD